MRPRLSRTLALTTVLTALLAPAAFAEDADIEQAEPITVIGQRPSYAQDDTSSATKTDTPLRDVPQSVSIITNDLIEDQAMRSMADVVRYVPGVSMGQGEGHRGLTAGPEPAPTPPPRSPIR